MAASSRAGVQLASEVDCRHPSERIMGRREADEVGEETGAAKEDPMARRRARDQSRVAAQGSPGALGHLPGLVATGPGQQERLTEEPQHSSDRERAGQAPALRSQDFHAIHPARPSHAAAQSLEQAVCELEASSMMMLEVAESGTRGQVEAAGGRSAQKKTAIQQAASVAEPDGVEVPHLHTGGPAARQDQLALDHGSWRRAGRVPALLKPLEQLVAPG